MKHTQHLIKTTLSVVFIFSWAYLTSGQAVVPVNPATLKECYKATEIMRLLAQKAAHDKSAMNLFLETHYGISSRITELVGQKNFQDNEYVARFNIELVKLCPIGKLGTYPLHWQNAVDKCNEKEGSVASPACAAAMAYAHISGDFPLVFNIVGCGFQKDWDDILTKAIRPAIDETIKYVQTTKGYYGLAYSELLTFFSGMFAQYERDVQRNRVNCTELTVRVIYDVSKKPVKAAKIQLFNKLGMVFIQKTGSDGNCSFPLKNGDEVKLILEKPGFKSQEKNIIADGNAQIFRLTMNKKQVKVLDSQSGEPIPQAKVVFENAGGKMAYLTDGVGELLIPFTNPEIKMDLEVQKVDYMPNHAISNKKLEEWPEKTIIPLVKEAIQPCDGLQKSGGQGDSRITVGLGKKANRFWFFYENYENPDEIIIYHGDENGPVIWQTIGPVSGSNQLEIVFPNLPPTDRVVVRVIGRGDGTEWNFMITCPN